MKKQVLATITVTETGWFNLEKDETPEQFKNRCADIYLWNNDGTKSMWDTEKTDIGGSTKIEILQVEE